MTSEPVSGDDREVTFTLSDDGYILRSVCTCGWESHPVFTGEEAGRAWDAHEEVMHPPGAAR